MKRSITLLLALALLAAFPAARQAHAFSVEKFFGLDQLPAEEAKPAIPESKQPSGPMFPETVPFDPAHGRLIPFFSPARAPTISQQLIILAFSAHWVASRSHQALNDPKKTTGESWGRLIRLLYERLSGLPLQQANWESRSALRGLLSGIGTSLQNHQRRLLRWKRTGKGRPPYYTGERLLREAGVVLRADTGIGLHLAGVTARTARGRADAFETNAIGLFRKIGRATAEKGYGEQGGESYRYVRPVYTEKPCLNCHGTSPYGRPRDLLGFPREGYREGSLRGVISVVIPTTPQPEEVHLPKGGESGGAGVRPK